MSDENLNDFFKNSLDSIESFTKGNYLFAQKIECPAGVTVIPMSKVHISLVSTGVAAPTKKTNVSGIGGGTFVTAEPLAYVTVDRTGETAYHAIDGTDSPSSDDKIIDDIPAIIRNLKDLFG